VRVYIDEISSLKYNDLMVSAVGVTTNWVSLGEAQYLETLELWGFWCIDFSEYLRREK